LGPEFATRSVVTEAVRVELAGLPDAPSLAAAALLLAERLDAGPADREAVLLARELRLTLAEVRARAGVAGVSDVERFLAGISTPSFRGPGD
jgi:hypothetical protein